MAVFVDTSALFALLDGREDNHLVATDRWAELAGQNQMMVASNYILLETVALVGRRLGLQAVRDFQADFSPLLQVHWVDRTLHERALAVLLSAGLRHLSLVDCVSFEVMRELGLDTAFTFDVHFAQQGFRCIP